MVSGTSRAKCRIGQVRVSTVGAGSRSHLLEYALNSLSALPEIEKSDDRDRTLQPI
jgi:hypothetical protein